MIPRQLRARLDRLAARCPKQEWQEIRFVGIGGGGVDDAGNLIPLRVVSISSSPPGCDPRDGGIEIPLDSPEGLREQASFEREEAARLGRGE